MLSFCINYSKIGHFHLNNGEINSFIVDYCCQLAESARELEKERFGKSQS